MSEGKTVKNIYEATNVKLKFRERVDYAVAEFGYNSIYYWVSAYMLIFYTDIVGVTAAACLLYTSRCV